MTPPSRDSQHASETDRCARIVVVGTGTNVGKTWFAASLCRGLRRRAVECIGLKPVESGVDPVAADAEELARASGRVAPRAPYCFRPPLSPHLAARQAQQTPRLEPIQEYVTEAIRVMSCHVMSFAVIETAGGLFTPLAPGLTNWELARALDPSVWVLVAPDSLGVLHETTATLEAARARGRAPDFVVLSAARPADASTGTNAAELESLGIVTPVAVLSNGDDDLSEFTERLISLHAAAHGA
jgi:dethiobiotin synthetase